MHILWFISIFLFDFMSSKHSISILGCGWLGLPLAKSFISDGVMVRGSTTSPEKLSLLGACGIEPYLVQSADPGMESCGPGFLNSDVLIILVPPGRTPLKQERYFHLLNGLTPEIDKSSISKIIFISSSSVYGETNEMFSENDDPRTDTETGMRMLEAERIISAGTRVPLFIVRLAGLIGPGRHPGRFFAGRTGIPNGLSPVNLIHQEDASGIIRTLAQGEFPPGIYNGCTPDHPSRQDFYVSAARKLGVALPEFLAEKTSWKIIRSDRVREVLAYQFRHPALLECLESDSL